MTGDRDTPSSGRSSACAARSPVFGPRYALSLLLLSAPLPAQAPVRYSESVSTEVRSRTAAAEQSRSLRREAQYEVTRRADTTVVQVLATELEEQGGEGTVQFNTDGFVGGRWKLVTDTAGKLRVVDRPFIPPVLLAVSDLTTAMDDFFPPHPVPLAVGEKGRDALGRQWERRADSAAIQRYHWDLQRQRDTVMIVRDSLPLNVEEQIRESSELHLDIRGTAVAWVREIVTEVTSRAAGRAVRATIRHRIAVRRDG